MSDGSTETESGGEEEMAMMSITDVMPGNKNLAKETVVFAKNKPEADSVRGRGLKNGSPAAQGTANMGSPSMLDDAENGSISRCESETVKKEGEYHRASTQMLTIQEQMIILRQEQCRLLKEREKRVKEGRTSASGASKVADARDRLARAKYNREQLELHYRRKEALAAEEGATLEVVKQLKDEYFGLVRQAGELDLQLKEMEEELTSAHHSLGRMERELWAAEDKNGSRKMVANPWQVGVPYGSGRSGR